MVLGQDSGRTGIICFCFPTFGPVERWLRELRTLGPAGLPGPPPLHITPRTAVQLQPGRLAGSNCFERALSLPGKCTKGFRSSGKRHARQPRCTMFLRIGPFNASMNREHGRGVGPARTRTPGTGATRAQGSEPQQGLARGVTAARNRFDRFVIRHVLVGAGGGTESAFSLSTR